MGVDGELDVGGDPDAVAGASLVGAELPGEEERLTASKFGGGNDLEVCEGAVAELESVIAVSEGSHVVDRIDRRQRRVMIMVLIVVRGTCGGRPWEHRPRDRIPGCFSRTAELASGSDATRRMPARRGIHIRTHQPSRWGVGDARRQPIVGV